MAKGVRVNLSVPERFDQVLGALAKLSGRSKASWVMEAIEFQYPAWCKRMEAMKWGTPLEVLPSAENKGRVDLARSQACIFFLRSGRYSARLYAPRTASRSECASWRSITSAR